MNPVFKIETSQFLFFFYTTAQVAPDAAEEEKFDLNDMEEAIKSNLVDDEPLPVEVLENIVPELWRKEPYRLFFRNF